MKKMRNFITARRIIVVGTLFVLGLLIYSDSALAQVGYNSLVRIPGIPSNVGITRYLGGLYNFLTGVVGIVAMGAIIIGGVRYMTSAGNPSAAEDAKHTISSAIFGLILALASWMIIREINMDILVLRNPSMPFVTTSYTDTAVNSYNCALSGGAGTAASPCYCVDNPTKPIVVPSAPYVIATSPDSCRTNVPTTLPYAIQIKYSDIMDPATVGTATAFSISPAITISSIDSNSTGSSTSVAINLGASLANNMEYTVTVKSGSGLNERLSDHVTMAADYVYKFTTGATFATPCTGPSFGSVCQRVCSDPTFDGKYHCGWRYIRLKMNTSGASDGKYFFFDNSAGLWEFFLLNEGKHDLLNLPNTNSIIVGADTYDCALYLSERAWGGLENAATVWVKTGIEIDSSGNSIRQNIMDSADAKGITNPFVACNVSPDPPTCDAVMFEGFGSIISGRVPNLWNGHYTDSNILKDNCGDCTFSVTNTQMRPVSDLICAKDSTGRAAWHKK